MTNIRLRIEDAIPAVGLGSVSHFLYPGAPTTGCKGLSNTKVDYRMAKVTPAGFETI